MYKFWCFIVSTNIMFPKPEYYLKYKGLEFKYITRYKEKKADNLIVRYSELSDDEVYKLIAEYLNSLAFCHDAFMSFRPIIKTENNFDLTQVRYMSDEVIKFDGFTCVPTPCLTVHVENEEQAQLISLYRQAKSNENCYFKLLFYWHALVYPETSENKAIELINSYMNNPPEHSQFYAKHIKGNPVFAKSKKIEKSLGDYIKQGIRHSIAHITRNQKDAVSLKLENYEQLSHIYTVAAILEDIAKYRIEEIYKVERFAPMDDIHEFNPNVTLQNQ